MKKKVRIKSLPKGYHLMPDGNIMKDSDHMMADGGSVRKNLSSIPREYANLEAERGEIALTDMGTGELGMFAIGGQRHSNGGTPLNLNPGSFIYSDTRKMKIKDPEFLAKYGKTKPVTPAKLVKPYLKMNDYKQVLEDQNADDIQKRTASNMINNFKGKAGEIAFYQEAMKGFPQGIPGVAEEYAQSIMGATEMAYGGYIPKAQKGGSPRYNAFLPDAYIKHLGNFEGGLSKDPRDNAAKRGQTSDGYHTNKGVTYATYKALAKSVLGRNPSEADFKNLSRQDALKIVDHFGKKNNLDDLKDPAVASVLHSFYWGGMGAAMQNRVKKSIKDQLGVDVTFDSSGALTPESVKNLNSLNTDQSSKVFDTLIGQRKAFLRNLDDYDAYGRGWDRRLDAFDKLQNEGLLNFSQPQTSQTSQDWRTSVATQAQNNMAPPYPEWVRVNTPVDRAPRVPLTPQAAQNAIPSITPYPGGKTQPGSYTPEGISNKFNRNLPEYLKSWEGAIPGISKMNNSQAQSAIYDYLLENEPNVIKNMWGTYGLTEKGKQNKDLLSKYKDGRIDPKELTEEDLKNLKSAYTDNLFGVRQMDVPPAYTPSDAAPESTPEPSPENKAAEPAPATTASQPTTTAEPTTDQQTGSSRTPNVTQDPYTQDSPGAVPFEQDVRNYLTNLQNRNSERKRYAWADTLPFMPADPTYMDDTRTQGMLAGQARSMAETLGAFAGPQQLASRISQISGTSGEQAANIQAQLQQGNTSIANIFSERNAQLADATNRANLASMIQLYDKNVKTDESYDEAMRRYNTESANLKNALVTNAYRAKTMNKLNPMFNITPDKGRMFNTGNIEFMPGVSAATFDVNNYTSQRESADNAFNAEVQRIADSPLTDENKQAAFKALYENRAKQTYGGSSQKSQSFDPMEMYNTVMGMYK